MIDTMVQYYHNHTSPSTASIYASVEGSRWRISQRYLLPCIDAFAPYVSDKILVNQIRVRARVATLFPGGSSHYHVDLLAGQHL